MKIEDVESEIIAEFENFEDWIDKYNYIIDLGKSLPVIEEIYKIDNNMIGGCQSKVWLHASFENGEILFKADSDAIITKGIVGLLVRVLSGHPPQEIIDAKLDFIDKIGLRDHLSPTRANGLTAMIKQMKFYAFAYQMKGSGVSNNNKPEN